MIFLDSNAEVEAWSYEKIVIEYVSNLKTGKIRKYYPDFYVRYFDGREELVEVKPSRKTKQLSVVKKSKAAELWCSQRGMTYRILTEIELKDMSVI